MDDLQLEQRARGSANRHAIDLDLEQKVGGGNDGTVWSTDRNSVIKALHRERTYHTELQCYQRLLSRNVLDVDGLAVPMLVNYATDLLVIEMTVVHPPYLLDFGKAYIDEPPPYSPEQLAIWHRSFFDYFPRSDVPRVHLVLQILKTFGISYMDPRPWNIRFRATEDSDDDEGGDYDNRDDGAVDDY